MTNSEGQDSFDEPAAAATDSQHGDIGTSLAVALGGLVGIPLGAAFGAATCYMTGWWDEMPQGVLWGSIAGIVVGALTILLERSMRPGQGQYAIATRVGIVLGLAPTMLIVPRIVQGVANKLLIGAAFIGPAAGVMIGAFFDRAIDEWFHRNKPTGVLFAALGMGICWLLIAGFDSAAYSLSEEEIEHALRSVVRRQWADDPQLEDATIRNVVVARDGRRNFVGSFDARHGDETIRFTFDAKSDGVDVVFEMRLAEE